MLHRTLMIGWIGAGVLTVSALSTLVGQAVDTAPGLAVGQAAPPFTLPDQHGKPQELAKLLEKGKVAIVFYRSADW